jgi:hypothetical protein
MHRHEDPKNCTPWETIAFDNATVIPNDLCNQSKTEASPARFRCHEGVEQIAHQIAWHARPIILDTEFERKSDTRLRSRHSHSDSRTEGGRQFDFGIILIDSNSFCRILH